MKYVDSRGIVTGEFLTLESYKVSLVTINSIHHPQQYFLLSTPAAPLVAQLLNAAARSNGKEVRTITGHLLSLNPHLVHIESSSLRGYQ